MADRTALGLFGLVFGGITLAVTMIAFIVVHGHVEGGLVMDHTGGPAQLASSSVR